MAGTLSQARAVSKPKGALVIRHPAFLVVPLALLPGPAAAQLLSMQFADPFCYARTYSAEHLASHPRQRVRMISLRRTADANPPGDNRSLEFELSVRARGARENWGGVAVCRNGTERQNCWMEGDMGQFTLARLSNDTIELRVVRADGLSFETETTFESIGAAGSDDRVFRLNKAPINACAD
ncbi:MAG: hypothetical protein HC900_10440 [Methylacidiphilales bacterium]|nr:hypothetical protein [Candidatus Methylacidiphilales bacterium]